jgi:hypothetical protein
VSLSLERALNCPHLYGEISPEAVQDKSDRDHLDAVEKPPHRKIVENNQTRKHPHEGMKAVNVLVQIDFFREVSASPERRNKHQVEHHERECHRNSRGLITEKTCGEYSEKEPLGEVKVTPWEERQKNKKKRGNDEILHLKLLDYNGRADWDSARMMSHARGSFFMIQKSVSLASA